MSNDPRLDNLIRINDPDPKAGPRLLMWSGPKTGAYHDALLRTKAATERFLAEAYDIRQNRHYGPAEVGRRVRESSAPMLKALNDAAAKLVEHKARLQGELRSAKAVPGYDKLGHWQAAFDLRLVDWFRAQTPIQQASLMAQILANPTVNLEVADALQRVPLTLGGLTWAERNSLRLASLRTLNPAEFERLDTERQQLEAAETAVRMALAALQQQGGSRQDIQEHAPAAHALTAPEAVAAGWGELPENVRIPDEQAAAETA